MAEYVTLMGAEQVQNAGQAMRSAADEMKHAASEISYAFDQHKRFMEDWLQQFTAAMELNKKGETP
ncbi:MAG: hypothetical protein Q7S17_05115 [Xanthobacteraceae bacterium]|nr:hypothetical protein [Xanthobacteraceae bacterium]